MAAVNVSGWPSRIATSLMFGVSTGSMPRSCSASSTARGNQAVHHVVMNLLAEPLLDDRGRRFARAEAGQPHFLGVAARDPVDLRVHDVGRDLDRRSSSAFR